MGTLSLRNLTRRSAPRRAYKEAHRLILPAWDISLVFATDAKAQALNTALRRKHYIPNVLSYTVGKRSGEVIICLAEAKRQCASYDMRYEDFVLFLFIHGLLHLKGRSHGSTMEKEERAVLARLLPIYPSHDSTKNRNRHRPGNTPGQSRHRRGTAR